MPPATSSLKREIALAKQRELEVRAVFDKYDVDESGSIEVRIFREAAPRLTLRARHLFLAASFFFSSFLFFSSSQCLHLQLPSFRLCVITSLLIALAADSVLAHFMHLFFLGVLPVGLHLPLFISIGSILSLIGVSIAQWYLPWLLHNVTHARLSSCTIAFFFFSLSSPFFLCSFFALVFPLLPWLLLLSASPPSSLCTWRAHLVPVSSSGTILFLPALPAVEGRSSSGVLIDA